MEANFQISGQVLDVLKGEIFGAKLTIEEGKISSITPDSSVPNDASVIAPGGVNAHMHIESTKTSPMAAGIALSEAGVLGTVSDPHEIANVCGVDGLNWMLQQAAMSPIQIMYGVPSCVPATSLGLETSGAQLSADQVCQLLDSKQFGYLAEVMNWPGVINNDPGLMQMINHAIQLGLPVDGHAPEVRADNLRKYYSKGIQTCHESSSYEEGLEKLSLGMKLLIREGSAAKNFDELIALIKQYPSEVMFCTDDSEPHELKDCQPLALVRRGLQMGYNLFDLMRAASVNPIKHYNLDVGLLQPSDYADFIILDNLRDLNVVDVYRKGKKIVKDGKSTVEFIEPILINNFSANPITIEDIEVPATNGLHTVRIIDVIPGQIITKASEAKLLATNGQLNADPKKDILKLVILNRYQPDQKPQVVFVRNFGIKNGAIAGSIAHDSHNIIAVGSDDKSITEAINLIVANKGGVSLVGPQGASVVPLPIGGLMSNKSADIVGSMFTKIELASKQLGTTLPSAYMSLSFLALLVIPELKVSDKVGLFDAREFKPVSLFA
jgi:adenine deaminase